MKVLFIHHLPEIGGATQSLLKLVECFQKKGHSVEVVFFKSTGTAIELFASAGIKYSIFKRGRVFQHAYGAYMPIDAKTFYRPFVAFTKSVFSILPSYRLLRSKAIDVVYLNTSILFPFAIAAKLASKPCVWHLREQIHDGHIGFRKWWLKFVFKKFASKVFVISKTNKLVLGQAAEVVYNSVDLGIFRPQIEEDLRGKNDFAPKHKIVFLGGRVMSKGADILVEAAALLISDFELDIQFIIAGSFNIDNDNGLNAVELKVKKLFEEHDQLKQRFVFTGALENVAPLLGISTILVWPAKVPHFARPIMEAMAVGLPIIASDFASTREILDEDVNGILIKPEARELADKIFSLLSDPELRNKMSSNNKLKARALFDAEVNNSRIVSQTQELLNGL